MKVRWSAQASRDLKAAIDYIAERHERAASRAKATLRAAAELLEHRPNSGSRVETNVYKLSRPPYLMLYRFENNAIIITRLNHSSQNWR